jgi:hypothetical protein
MFSPDDFLRELDQQDFDPDQFLRETSEKPGKLESLARGGIQGATLGFADELAGGGEALYDKLRGNPQAILDLYRQHRDESRQNFEAAREANPKSFLAGEFVGSAPAAFAPGSGIAKAAALGAATGFGASNADITQREIARAALDTGIGGTVGAGAHKLGEVIAPKVLALIDSGRSALGTGAKKAISAVLGPSEEAIEARLAGGAKDDAASYPELAEKMKDSLARLREQIADGDKNAWNKLNPYSEQNFGGIDKEVLNREVDDVRRKLRINGNIVGHADTQAESILQKLTGDIDQFGEGISQQDLKGIVQRLDDNINWDNPGSNATNQALTRVRASFSTILKDNPEYSEAMDPVAKKTALMNDIKRLFNFKNEPGEGLVPTDTTASKIKTSLSENKAITQEKLEALKSYTGDDYVKAAKDYDLSREFQGGHANGSRRVNLAGILGASLGSLGGTPGAVVGAGAGGMLGAHLDKEGGVYAGKLIDWYVKHQPQALGKFAQPLVEAASRGPSALAATHFVLQKTSPEYRAHLKSAVGVD